MLVKITLFPISTQNVPRFDWRSFQVVYLIFNLHHRWCSGTSGIELRGTVAQFALLL
jgi:hypothetical protein